MLFEVITIYLIIAVFIGYFVKDKIQSQSDNEMKFDYDVSDVVDRYKQNSIKAHRDDKGRIIIENTSLYELDCINYSMEQVTQWLIDGKYNL